MTLKRKIIVMGLLVLGMSCGMRAFAKDAADPKVVDLNQIDLEQVEDAWENGSPNAPLNVDRGPRIKDIVEPTTEYTYASFGKPDPFAIPDFAQALEPAPPGEEAPMAELGPNGKEIAIQSPLQAYPIDSLTVKGVWQLSDGEMRAVILTPKNEGIVVKSGDPMSSGKVLTIERSSIVVRLYRLKKDGVREYEDKRMTFGSEASNSKGSIKLVPGKEAQFPGMESSADIKAVETDPAKKAVNDMIEATAGALKSATEAMKKAAAEKGALPPPANVPKPINAPAAAAPGPAAPTANAWPYNGTAPAQPLAPTSGRPGANSK